MIAAAYLRRVDADDAHDRIAAARVLLKVRLGHGVHVAADREPRVVLRKGRRLAAGRG
jgi:hypothetical protein